MVSNKHIHHARIAGLLSIIIVVGVLFIGRDAKKLFDRQFSVPQKLDLATILSDPATYQDRYIEVEGRLQAVTISVCDLGHQLFEPGATVKLQEDAVIIGVDVITNRRWDDSFDHQVAVVQGWLRRFDGRVGCDARSVGGPNGTDNVTVWYIEAENLRAVAP